MAASLAGLDFAVTDSGDARELRTALEATRPDWILLFVDAATRPSFEVLGTILSLAPGAPVLLLPTTSQAQPEGARSLVHLLADAERLATLPAPCEPGARGAGPFDPFLGRSDAIRKLGEDARIALGSESPVLIEGETGTGKGVLAEWLHRNGPRAQHPFVDLNCAGFSRELMDSELFGHERGAFTGAVSAKPGLLEVTDGGTLFLDEIGDMELPIQAKLLKVIEEKRFRRIGETRERRADVRIIAATHRDLLQLVREGRFREDLYYRIGVLSLRIPPLRRRREDLPVLVTAISRALAQDLGRPGLEVSRAALRLLSRREWPGNLRELRNTMERAILAAGSRTIEPHHLAAEDGAGSHPEPAPPGGTLLDVERAYIERVLREEPHVERAARRLGMARSTLYQKLRLLGIRRSC